MRAANTALTWRDVKLILAASARKNDSSDGGWRSGTPKYGAAGSYNFNHEYGFGVVDAKAAVDLAAGWENLPPFIETDLAEATPNVLIPFHILPPAATSTIAIGTEVEFIEFVEVIADFDATGTFRGVAVELVSPSNTVSTLAFPADGKLDGFGIDPDFRFGSARHLGEDPAGIWTLRLLDYGSRDPERLKSWRLKIYGHRSTPSAPGIDFLDRRRRALTVYWRAPSLIGASEVTSYDVRYILSDAPDKADARWTEVEGVWRSGALSATVTGLLDGATYDVQVRGVNAKGGGAWSESTIVETLPNRAPRAADLLAAPDLQVGDGSEDVDVSGAFEDPDDDMLTYDASSSAPGVAKADVLGSRVRLTPVAPGTATITVTATDLAGTNRPATATFDVRVKAMRGVTISRDALTVDEGSDGIYTVVLDSEPTGPVTITPTVPADADVSVDPTELTFTTSNWSSAQAVSVDAALDTDTAADAPVTMNHRVSGADYGSVPASSVRVTIVERDTSSLSLEAAEAQEGDGTLVFQVKLSKSSSFGGDGGATQPPTVPGVRRRASRLGLHRRQAAR